jgi:acetylglutamate kinase
MRILAKVGGAQLGDAAARAAFASAVASARAAGHEVVLVHGGGDQVRAWSKRLGIEDRYERGLRVTDDATAEVVTAVLGGEVGRELVRALSAAGLRAVSLTGADGGLYTARRKDPRLGFVGEVERCDASVVEALLAAGCVPVIASIAPLDVACEGDGSRFYNINADSVVGPLAAACGAGAALVLTDVPGVKGADGVVVPSLDPAACAALEDSGVIAGGMLPKVAAALAAAAAAPNAVVKIAPSAGADALTRALEPSVGTAFPLSPSGTSA